MRLFRRRPRLLPEPIPMRLPTLAGDGGWPDPALASRSFEASTYHELGTRRAFEADAHGTGEALLEAALPLLRTGASAEDEPYLRSVFAAAARTGAGLGLVERDLASTRAQSVSPAVAGALWQARRALPAMQEEWARMASWFLLGGHWAARGGPSALAPLLAGLRSGNGDENARSPHGQADP